MLLVQMHILAISGSLRVGSSNTELLRAAALLATPSVRVTLYEGLADLPAFNPDLMEDAPGMVLFLRAQVGAAAGLLISSPEYGHGMPGPLKNALDWLFSGEQMIDKPVAILNASPLSVYADASLRETIKLMSARLVATASVTMPVSMRNLDAAAMAAVPEVAATLRAALAVLAQSIQAGEAAKNT